MAKGLIEAIGEHLPWVPRWAEGQYRPSDDEIELMHAVMRNVIRQRRKRMERNSEVFWRWYVSLVSLGLMVLVIGLVVKYT